MIAAYNAMRNKVLLLKAPFFRYVSRKEKERRTTGVWLLVLSFFSSIFILFREHFSDVLNAKVMGMGELVQLERDHHVTQYHFEMKACFGQNLYWRILVFWIWVAPRGWPIIVN